MKLFSRSWGKRGGAGLLGAGLLALAVVGCQHETETVTPADTNYYPTPVGSFRIYDVVDSTWTNNVKTAVRYQFRERVTEQYPDAAGRTAYRVVRSRRTLATDPWRDDSVLVVSPSTQNVLVTRNNRPTVDLIFPVREGYWNQNAFNVLNGITDENIHYIWTNEPFSVTSGGRTFSYPSTLATSTDEREGLLVNAQYYYRLRQVYELGTGPVFRSRRRFIYCAPGNGNCIPSPSFIYQGSSRTEVLVERSQ